MTPGEKTRQAIAAALEVLGVDVTLVPVRHPAVDPDPIRRDGPRWARAREAYA